MTRPSSDRTSKTWIAVIISGLLGSNCCALQLVLNSLGFGCAGFAILSPFRLHIVLASSVALLVLKPFRHSLPVHSRFLQGGLFCSLVFMPEWIHLYSSNGIHYFASGSVDYLPSTPVLVRVSGMKCAACGERARTISVSVPCVLGAAVFWESGFIKLQTISGIDSAECGEMVSTILMRSGFQIISINICKHEKSPSFFAPWSVKFPRHTYLNSTGADVCSLFS
jgi:hypothetical protein